MSKHTPGPWAYQEDSDAYTHIVRGPGNRFICQLAQTTSAEIEANARLIAASPELFRIVERLSLLADGLANSNSSAEEMATRLAEDAKKIVAKATGGAQ